MNKDRVNQLLNSGYRFNGEYFNKGDVSIHHTEVLCDTEKEWNDKIEKIEIHLEKINE